mmetsp:Transcript_8031/g.19590  ORF Transcript_8031/g.19590 Transcript_8031/m.19590 type:complete len:247 (-) Transcript_8031:202-942(-)
MYTDYTFICAPRLSPGGERRPSPSMNGTVIPSSGLRTRDPPFLLSETAAHHGRKWEEKTYAALPIPIPRPVAMSSGRWWSSRKRLTPTRNAPSRGSHVTGRSSGPQTLVEGFWRDGAVKRHRWWFRKKERNPRPAPHVDECPEGKDSRESQIASMEAVHLTPSHPHISKKHGRGEPAIFLAMTVMGSDIARVSKRARIARAVEALSRFQQPMRVIIVMGMPRAMMATSSSETVEGFTGNERLGPSL